MTSKKSLDQLAFPLENYPYWGDLSEEIKPPTTAKFYHYTDFEAGQKIISGCKENTCELWASQLSFMNDAQEFQNGLNLIIAQLTDNPGVKSRLPKNIVKDFIEGSENEDLYRDIFLICFSMNNNSLTQWKFYGKNCGVAIEFDLRKCKYKGFIADVKKFKGGKAHLPYKVIYDDDTKIKIIDKLIDYALEQYKYEKNDEDRERNLKINLEYLYAICPLFKHEHFSEEKECRLLFWPTYKRSSEISITNYPKLFNYRMRNGILLPYMKIKLKLDVSHGPIIPSIMVGPGQKQNLILSGFEYLNRKALNEDIYIEHSETPFRG